MNVPSTPKAEQAAYLLEQARAAEMLARKHRGRGRPEMAVAEENAAARLRAKAAALGD